MNEVMTDAQMWALIVGFFSPLVLAIVQQPRWSGGVRVTITVIYSLIAGSATAYFAGGFNGRTIVSSILIVLVSTIAFYNGLWKPAGTAPAIEGATSPGGGTRRAVPPTTG